MTLLALLPNNGGYDFAADPANSALIQPIFWTPQTDPAMLLVSAGQTPEEGFTVRVDDLRAHAIAEHDVDLIRVSIRGDSYDVAVIDASEGHPVGAFIMFDELTPDRLTAVERLWNAMSGKRVPPDPRMTLQRHRRARLMLRVIDARATGATYRQIAAEIFPHFKHDAATWVESPMRETIARLVRDGLAFVRGGYRKILHRPRRSR